jgi:hypothetical protein
MLGVTSEVYVKIETVGNIAVIVAATIFIGMTIYDRLSPGAANGRSSAERMIGRTLPLSPANISKRATAVLCVSPKCHFCTESMQFYSKLATLSARRPGSFRVLAVTPAGAAGLEESRQYFTDHGVTVDGVTQIAFSPLGIAGTPTVALLDSSGRIVNAWIGKLSAKQEEAAFKTIGSLCGDSRGA